MQPTQNTPLCRLRSALESPWALLLLALLVLCYPLGSFFMWLTAALLAALCCLGSLQSIAAAYVFLFLFDNMLPFPLLGGSLVRVLQGGLLARAATECLSARAWPDRFTCIAALCTALSCGISFLLKGMVGDSVSFAVNMAVFLALRLALRARLSQTGREQAMAGILLSLLRTYVVSALTAICFGVAYNRFYVLDAGEGVSLMIRFLGTHEPNFMAMFLDIALLLWLSLPSPARASGSARLLDAAVLGTLLAGLLLTGSMTGLGIAACMTAVCGFLLCARRKEGTPPRSKRWAVYALRLICGMALALALSAGCTAWVRAHPIEIRDIYALDTATGLAAAETPIFIPKDQYYALRAAGDPVQPHLLTQSQWAAYCEEHDIPPVRLLMEEVEPYLQDDLARFVQKIPVVGSRFYTILGYARCYGLDAATSGRWGLIVEKLRDFSALPLAQKLLGCGPDPERTYFPLFQTFGYSHNSFLDLITCFGVIGSLGLLWWFFLTLRRGRFFGYAVGEATPEGDALRTALLLARIALLLHAATLSMFLNRVFLFFFLG